MKITIESTDLFIHVRGQKCRVWRGVSENGAKCDLAIASVRAHKAEDCTEFERNLRELSDPDEGLVVDMRFVW